MQIFFGPTSHLPKGVPICDVDSSYEAKIKMNTFTQTRHYFCLNIILFLRVIQCYTMIFIQTLNALFCWSNLEIGPDYVCRNTERQIKYEEKNGKKRGMKEW